MGKIGTKMNLMKEHWNRIYSKTENTLLGWYEKIPSKTIELFEKLSIPKDGPILDVGIGTSNFFDYLISNNYTNLWGLDISDVAIIKKKKLLGNEHTSKINWIVEDIRDPEALKEMGKVKVWNDRALLHFLTEQKDREIYVNHLKSKLQKGGYAIIGVFSLMAPKKCSGLDLINYGENELKILLGPQFKLIESIEYKYFQPSGNPRQYIYTVFQKL
jgi:hypothetical protein